MRRIKRNAIPCSICGDIIESTCRHDFKQCSCGRVFVDGGLDYLRGEYTKSIDDYTELSVFKDDEQVKHTGTFL